MPSQSFQSRLHLHPSRLPVRLSTLPHRPSILMSLPSDQSILAHIPPRRRVNPNSHSRLTRMVNLQASVAEPHRFDAPQTLATNRSGLAGVCEARFASMRTLSLSVKKLRIRSGQCDTSQEECDSDERLHDANVEVDLGCMFVCVCVCFGRNESIAKSCPFALYLWISLA